MKIAIASSGNNINSKIDNHLARCAFFLIYDDETKKIEFIENTSNKLPDGAGLAAINLLKKYNVKKIISTDVGYKVKNKLDELKIQIILINDNRKTIKDIIQLLKKS